MKSGNSPERGGCLTLFLIVLALFTVYGLVTAFSAQQMYQDLAAQGVDVAVIVPAWALPAQIAITIISLACIYGIFTWKKWGVYGLVGIWIVGMGLGAASLGGLMPLSLIILGIQVLLLWVALRGRWAYFG